jgi:hypothetical protein
MTRRSTCIVDRTSTKLESTKEKQIETNVCVGHDVVPSIYFVCLASRTVTSA